MKIIYCNYSYNLLAISISYVLSSTQERLLCSRVLSLLVVSLLLATYLPLTSEFHTITHSFLTPVGTTPFLMIFFCLQEHCGDRLREPHNLHICTILWCTPGMLWLKTNINTINTYCCLVLQWALVSNCSLIVLLKECLFVPCFNLCVRVQCVCSGILVGSGMQKIAALSNLVCYYCVGLPVGIALMFAAKLRILGNTFHPILLLHVQWSYKLQWLWNSLWFYTIFFHLRIF